MDSSSGVALDTYSLTNPMRRVPDVQKRLKALSQCFVHTALAMKLEAAGKPKQAAKEAKKAERWMLRYMKETGEI